jgi:hypothetical protein
LHTNAITTDFIFYERKLTKYSKKNSTLLVLFIVALDFLKHQLTITTQQLNRLCFKNAITQLLQTGILDKGYGSGMSTQIMDLGRLMELIDGI